MRYLEREIEPALRRDHQEPVAEAVHRTVGSGKLGRLGRLPERQRRTLLMALEGRPRHRRRVAPEVIVRLTSVIALTDLPEDRADPRAVALPVR